MSWDDGSAYFDRIAPGLYAWIQPHGGWMVSNAGVIAAAGDAVLVDTVATEARNRALLAEVAQVAANGPVAVVNTHYHPDHTYGNCFVPASARIYAHHLARAPQLRAGTGAQAELPADYGKVTVRAADVTFEDSLTLHLDGFPVHAQHVGPAHTTNDVVVWAPEQQVLFAGDVVFTEGTPFLLEGSLLGFKQTLQHLRGLEPVALVPGHGPVVRDEGVADVLLKMESYADFVLELAGRGHAEGLTPMDTARAYRDNEFAAWPESERLVGNLHRAYVDLFDLAPPFPLNVPNVMPEMVELHGGPITTCA